MKPIKIPDDVIPVLANATVEPRAVVLNGGQLDRALYVATNKVLVALGGRWDRRAQAHVFEHDPGPALEEAVLTGWYSDEKRDYEAFYTPPAVIDRMLELAEIKPHHDVLEPSAGAGAIAVAAHALLETGTLITYELRNTPETCAWHADLLVRCDPNMGVDFLMVDPAPEREYLFDRVLMNPPFSRQQDVGHVTHAYRFLRPGGRLVAVMTPSWQYRQTARSEAFRELMDSAGGIVEELPAGSFKESGTGVNAVLVVLDR